MAHAIHEFRPYQMLRTLYRNARTTAIRLKRSILGTDKKIIADYFASHDVRGLHIGCGQHLIEVFINADLSSSSKDVLNFDATKLFPFGDESFDFIFSEHMIEHIPYADGLHMLRECCRVLKKGGKIRVSTPDLERVTALGRADRTELQNDYIAWSIGKFSSLSPDNDPAFVINNFFRDWGHQFIYAEQTLAASLERCGFAEVTKYPINHSGTPALRDLENQARMPEGFLALETLTLEATKHA